MNYGCMDVGTALRYLIQLLQVLHYLQTDGVRVLHEDIKCKSLVHSATHSAALANVTNKRVVDIVASLSHYFEDSKL